MVILSEDVLRSAKDPTKDTADAKEPAGTADASTIGRKETKELDYCSQLNRVLPPSIRVIAWVPVGDSFSARFAAESRTYRYFFVRRSLDLAAMQAAAWKFVGDHDFRNFCKIDAINVTNFRRVIHSVTLCQMPASRDVGDTTRAPGDAMKGAGGGIASIGSPEDVWFFEIRGQAFLWHQVRHMVSVLFLVGRGLEAPSVIDALLDPSHETGVPRKPQYSMAPESPLVLHRCTYSHLQFHYDPAVLWRLCHDLEQEWEEVTLKAARLRNALNILYGVRVRARDVQDVQAKATKVVDHADGRRTTKRIRSSKNSPPEATLFSSGSGDGCAQNPVEPGVSGSTIAEVASNRTATATNAATVEQSRVAGEAELTRSNQGKVKDSSEWQYTGTADVLVPWAHALQILGGLENAPGTRRAHVPLLHRPGAKTLAEKVAGLSGRQQQRKLAHDGQRAGIALDEDRDFFRQMRSQGNM